MPQPIDPIHIHLDGIGHLISDKKIEVPAYQRSFAWEKEQVENLFQDIAAAIDSDAPEYFLGSIVLTPGANDKNEVIDGQQRIATTLVFIAEVRNFLRDRDDVERANTIQSDYIAKLDRRTKKTEPNVVLNAGDNPFFQTAIVENGTTDPSTEAHRRLRVAKDIANEFVRNIAEESNDPVEALNDWLDYIDNKAKVIVVNVSSDANAYTIFEVLNDRGIDLSIADLLKNYLFSIADTRLGEVQEAWTGMRSLIASVESEQAIKSFIRHVWLSRHGVIREHKLYHHIRDRTTGSQQAVDLAVELHNAAADYVALCNPTDPKWHALGPAVQDAIYALGELRVVQNRPLVFAILRHFDDSEIRSALPMLICWTVRFLIGGSGGSGKLEHFFSTTAQRISAGKITTSRQLYESSRASLPSDAAFRNAFEKANVSKNYLARYYLRAIATLDNPNGEYSIGQHHSKVNLEHVLPRKPGKNWNHFTTEDVEIWSKRLGNLTVMDSALNRQASNAPFDDKKAIYAQSRIEITRSLADFPDWTPERIQERQNLLAEKAVRVWPLAPRI